MLWVGLGQGKQLEMWWAAEASEVPTSLRLASAWGLLLLAVLSRSACSWVCWRQARLARELVEWQGFYGRFATIVWTCLWTCRRRFERQYIVSICLLYSVFSVKRTRQAMSLFYYCMTDACLNKPLKHRFKLATKPSTHTVMNHLVSWLPAFN